MALKHGKEIKTMHALHIVLNNYNKDKNPAINIVCIVNSDLGGSIDDHFLSTVHSFFLYIGKLSVPCKHQSIYIGDRSTFNERIAI